MLKSSELSYNGFISIYFLLTFTRGFPGSTRDKESTCNAGDVRDTDSVPGWEQSPGGGHDNPLQYSCLEISIDRGSWLATVHRVVKSRTWTEGTTAHTAFTSGPKMLQGNNKKEA